MKLLKTTAIAGLLVASGAASALELSGNVALTSDYIWRGVSQTDGGPAVQGGFDADFGSGLYAGVWASNVDFGDDTSVEVDVYGGWAGEISGVGVDVGYIHYHYPQEGYQLDELYVGLSYGPASITYSYDLGLAEDELGDYTDLGLDLGEYSGVSFSVHAGYYDYADADGVWDYKLAASTSMLGVDWELAYTDNDDDDADEDTFLLTVSKSL